MGRVPAFTLAVCEHPAHAGAERSLADRLGVPRCGHDADHPARPPCTDFDFRLQFLATDDAAAPRLALLDAAGELGNGVWVDFVGGKMAHRLRFGGGRGQPLARAVGLKGATPPTVVDATAGLGRDAFVLASLGARVTLLERSPVLAALLEDGLRRATLDPQTCDIVEPGMTLIHTNAIRWLRHCEQDQRPDVVYLDPMYPHRDKSALVKKEMRALRRLVGDDTDADTLLHAALGCARRRVVVKRPRTAPALDGEILAGRRPASCVQSKNTRYDLYPVG